MWPLGLYTLLALAIVAAILAISALLGPRHHEPATGIPFESGVAATGEERVRLPVRFYLIAMFFVIFDLESAFIFAWAVAARPLGWAGWWEVLVFAAILLASLLYLARAGGLEWSGRQDGKRGSHGMVD